MKAGLRITSCTPKQWERVSAQRVFRGNRLLYIKENGCACDDDRFRIVYMALFLSAISETIKMDCDVRGYSCWSLPDIYEWGSYKPKFGLCSCDPNTFERIEKPSAYFYKDILF